MEVATIENKNPTHREIQEAILKALNLNDEVSKVRLIYWYEDENKVRSIGHIWEHDAVYDDIFTKAGRLRAHLTKAHNFIPDYDLITVEAITY